MISCLVFTGKHNVKVSETGKFIIVTDIVDRDENNVPSGTLTDMNIRDVPFVRYRFETYGEIEKEYILEMRKKFNKSVHMVEVRMTDNTVSELEMLEVIPNLVKYVYVDVTDTDFNNYTLGEYKIGLVEKIEDSGVYIDRLMLKDNTSLLDIPTVDIFKNEIKEITDTETGICGGPLCFYGGACLTAVKARELAAEYADNDECALPSANHESMNTCGCIRYSIINYECNFDSESKQKCKSKSNNDENKESKGNKEPKVKKAKGVKMINF